LALNDRQRYRQSERERWRKEEEERMRGVKYGITRNEIIIIVQLADKPRVYSSRATISGSLET